MPPLDLLFSLYIDKAEQLIQKDNSRAEGVVILLLGGESSGRRLTL